MKMKTQLRFPFKGSITLILAFSILFLGCKKDEEEVIEPTDNNSTTSYTITVGVLKAELKDKTKP